MNKMHDNFTEVPINLSIYCNIGLLQVTVKKVALLIKNRMAFSVTVN